MRVKMRTAAASAGWSAQPGQEVVVDDVEGQALIDGGYAELVVTQDELSAAKAAAAGGVVEETAVADPVEETAAKKSGKK